MPNPLLSSSPLSSSPNTNTQDPNPEFNIALLGAGGVGTIAALVLEKSGRARVTAIVRGRYGVVSRKGWEIESVDHAEVRRWRCWRGMFMFFDLI